MPTVGAVFGQITHTATRKLDCKVDKENINPRRAQLNPEADEDCAKPDYDYLAALCCVHVCEVVLDEGIVI